MKALVGAFNQEKALVGAFSVIVQPVVEPMDRFAALVPTLLLSPECGELEVLLLRSGGSLGCCSGRRQEKYSVARAEWEQPPAALRSSFSRDAGAGGCRLSVCWAVADPGNVLPAQVQPAYSHTSYIVLSKKAISS